MAGAVTDREPTPEECVAHCLALGWCQFCADPWNTAGCYYCLGGTCTCPCEPKPGTAEMRLRAAMGAPTTADDTPRVLMVVGSRCTCWVGTDPYGSPRNPDPDCSVHGSVVR